MTAVAPATVRTPLPDGPTMMEVVVVLTTVKVPAAVRLMFASDRRENAPAVVTNCPPPAAVIDSVRHWVVPAVRVTPPPVAIRVSVLLGARMLALWVMPPPL